MEDYKKLLTDLYTTHDPERVKQIDYFLERYKGKESQFYISQKAKYKSRKPVSDSRKIIEEALARIKSQSAEAVSLKDELKKKPVVYGENPITPAAETEEITTPVVETEEEEIPTPIVEVEKEDKIESFADEVLIENIRREEPSRRTERASTKEFYQTPYYYEEKTIPETPKRTTSSSIKPSAKDDWQNERKKEPASRPSTVLPPEAEKTFNQKYFLSILGIVSAATVFALIIFYVFFVSPRTYKPNTRTEKTVTAPVKKKIIATPKKKTTTPSKKEPVAAPKKETTTPAKKEDIAAPKKAIPIETKSIVVKKETTSPANQTKPAITQPKQTASVSGGLRIQKGDLHLPAYFVACYAVKTENHALKKIAELKGKGFEASYYWIPDFVPNGNTYFKVVIGPFSARMDAMRKLTPVQERAEFDAYVLALK